jgi:hypothetical protein
MTEPSELSIISKNYLTELSFDLIESLDNGMSKYYVWANSEMQLGLAFDRAYYECYITPNKKPFNSIDLIRLLRFLKNDKVFYKQELIQANLSYTLTANQYVLLFHENYNLIKDFLSNYDQQKFDSYNEFEFSYEGL